MENEDNEFAELINVIRQQISKIFVHWVDSSWFFSNSVELWKYIICTLHKSILIFSYSGNGDTKIGMWIIYD